MQERLIFPDWIGEFGWELMTWQARCRLIAKLSGLPRELIIVRSFPGMAPLYNDFATFWPHNHPGRAITFKPKNYRIQGEWIKFGNLNHDKPKPKLLFHARGGGNKAAKNTSHEIWQAIVKDMPRAASIGTIDDFHIFGTIDLRGCDLDVLMNYMASAELVIGQSSGPMHLAALCGTNLIVWGDDRTYFGETLEKRYKHTWNPFDVDVTYIYTDRNWQPNPNEVRAAIFNEIKLNGGEQWH